MTTALRAIALAALAASAPAAGGAAAQRLQPRIPPASARNAQPRAAADAPAVLAPASRHSLANTLLYGAGGAVLGGWAGYMTSQIVWSDWQRVSRPGGISRVRYTLTGAGIGAMAGALLGHHVTPGVSPAHPLYGTLPAITTEQIQASQTRTVEELVQLLRPQWLNARGNDLIQFADSAASPPAFGLPNSDAVRVYLDGEQMGGPEQLAEIPTLEALRVEYYDMKAATVRWGAGHSHGAINVITARGQH